MKVYVLMDSTCEQFYAVYASADAAKAAAKKMHEEQAAQYEQRHGHRRGWVSAGPWQKIDDGEWSNEFYCVMEEEVEGVPTFPPMMAYVGIFP